jgi:hypothetical protein
VTLRAHLLAVVAVAAVLAYIFVLVRRNQLRSKYALLWVAVAALLLPLAVFPDLLDWLSDRVGILYAPTTLLEARVRKLAEELALLRAERSGDPEAPRR